MKHAGISLTMHIHYYSSLPSLHTKQISVDLNA